MEKYLNRTVSSWRLHHCLESMNNFALATHIFWNPEIPEWGFKRERGLDAPRSSPPGTAMSIFQHKHIFSFQLCTSLTSRAPTRSLRKKRGEHTHVRTPCPIFWLPDALWKPRHPSKVTPAALRGSQEPPRSRQGMRGSPTVWVHTAGKAVAHATL